MSDKKVIAVALATGKQGGGLVRAILAEGPSSEFSVRALTRDPKSPGAQELAKAGAEVVEAHLHDEDSLLAAFKGAHGAFCVTPLEFDDPSREEAQIKALAGAAKRAGVKHVVWSTLDDTRNYMSRDDPRMPTLAGGHKVPHLDVKAEGDSIFRGHGVPLTCVLTSGFYENMLTMGPKKGDDGTFTLALPWGNDVRTLLIAVEDIGGCVLGVFKRGDEFIGRTIGIMGDTLTGAEVAQIFQDTYGVPVKYVHVDFDAFRNYGFPGAKELGNMFQFYHDFAPACTAARDAELSRQLYPGIRNFATWLAQRKGDIKLE